MIGRYSEFLFIGKNFKNLSLMNGPDLKHKNVIFCVFVEKHDEHFLSYRLELLDLFCFLNHSDLDICFDRVRKEKS